jgi:two-component sensor histidine kinase
MMLPGPAAARLSPDEVDDRLLLERIRLAGKIVIAGVVAVLVGELVLSGAGTRPGITVVQAANIGFVLVLLHWLRSPQDRRRNLLLALAGYAMTSVCTGAVGILARDPTTPLIVLVAVALGTATIIPWGAWWQCSGVVVSTGVAFWTVATLVDSPPTFLVQNVGSVLPTLAGTVFVSVVLARQRAQVLRAERERYAREASLRDAKSRLEREIGEHQRTEEMLRFALRELDHRVKNTLATVESVARRTLESCQSPADFVEAFQGRIQAMARVHTALAARKWKGLQVEELIELVVGPYRLHDDSISILCDGGFLSSDVARILSMALHELATNAAKYGALSTRAGRVHISSRIDTTAARRLHVEWQEANGPTVVDPTHRGLGTRLIEEGLAYESDGVATLRFPPTGVCCEIEIPLQA